MYATSTTLNHSTFTIARLRLLSMQAQEGIKLFELEVFHPEVFVQ